MKSRDNAVRNTWELRRLTRAVCGPIMRGVLVGEYVLMRQWLKEHPRRPR